MVTAYALPMQGSAQNLDHVFSALAHAVRRDILQRVSETDRTVAELARPHAMSLNAISKHIKKLEAAGLVNRQIDGHFHRISLRREPVVDAIDWLSHYVDLWESSLQNLKIRLENED